jgi:K+-transporting ATPase KdpF subunit
LRSAGWPWAFVNGFKGASMGWDYLIGGCVIALLIGYLLYALVNAQKF